MRLAMALPTLAVLTLTGLAACGGGGGGGTPTGGSAAPSAAATPPPSGWPAGTTIQLVDGETGQLVQGSVTVAGVSVPSGAPLQAAAANGATVDVVLPGFLPRQTLVRTGETRLVLWPESPALPGDYTRSLVYTVTAVPETLASLRRLSTRVRSVAVVMSADLQGDSPTVDAHRAAIDGVNGMAAPLGVAFQLGGTADFSIPARVDAAAGLCTEGSVRAFTSLWLSGTNEITRAEVTYCGGSIASTVGTIAHELGHTLGFRHSLNPNDMMFGQARSVRSTTPTAREALALRLMRDRRPGTEWPDNDRATTAAAAARVETVVD